MGKRKRGVAARTVVRLTAARWVSQKYGDKGLRALRAMGPDFTKELQAEILAARRKEDLSARERRLSAALQAIENQLRDVGTALQNGSCLPRLEAVVKALPDIAREVPKAEEPKEKAPEGEPAVASAQS